MKRSGSVEQDGLWTGKGNQIAIDQSWPQEVFPAAAGQRADHPRQSSYPEALEPVSGYPGPETDPDRNGLPDPQDQWKDF